MGVVLKVSLLCTFHFLITEEKLTCENVYVTSWEKCQTENHRVWQNVSHSRAVSRLTSVQIFTLRRAYQQSLSLRSLGVSPMTSSQALRGAPCSFMRLFTQHLFHRPPGVAGTVLGSWVGWWGMRASPSCGAFRSVKATDEQ